MNARRPHGQLIHGNMLLGARPFAGDKAGDMCEDHLRQIESQLNKTSELVWGTTQAVADKAVSRYGPFKHIVSQGKGDQGEPWARRRRRRRRQGTRRGRKRTSSKNVPRGCSCLKPVRKSAASSEHSSNGNAHQCHMDCCCAALARCVH